MTFFFFLYYVLLFVAGCGCDGDECCGAGEDGDTS